MAEPEERWSSCCDCESWQLQSYTVEMRQKKRIEKRVMIVSKPIDRQRVVTRGREWIGSNSLIIIIRYGKEEPLIQMSHKKNC